MKKVVVVLLFIFLLSSCMNKGADDMNYIKNIDNGFVPDEKTAERIADIVLTKVYGDKILSSKPYEIVLKNEIWYINGVLKPDDFGMLPLGGVPYIKIRKSDGAILGVAHEK